MYRHIAWMNDLSHRADHCLGAVRLMARAGQARVVLVHALGAQFSRAASADAALIRAREHLEALQASLGDIESTIEVRPGSPEAVAADLIDTRGVDLVIAGTTGVSGIDRFLIGSTANRLVRKLQTSVLVVGPRKLDALARLLCPVDLTQSELALGIGHAAEVARAHGADLTFLTMLEPGADVDDALAAEHGLLALVEDKLEEPLPREWRVRAVIDESPAVCILHTAEDFDAVIMTTAGRRGLKRLLGSSIAESVIKACPVPVLVAR